VTQCRHGCALILTVSLVDLLRDRDGCGRGRASRDRAIAPATAAVRVATPDEVRQWLETEAAAIAAETPFDGFDRALTHYVRDVALACREPGSFQSVDGSVTLTLVHDSISFGYSEYYFVDGAYQSLVIGD
jgi:hypothetical protein